MKQRVLLILICLLIFFIPANLFLKFVTPQAYVNGLLIDYLLPKLYASDLIIFVLLAMEGKAFSKRQLLWIGLTVVFFCLQFTSSKPLASIWYFAKILEMLGLLVFLIEQSSLFNTKAVNYCLAATLLFQSFIGIYQFQTQRSFFPSYIFFGEPNLSHRLLLAKGSFNGIEKILAYGTTAHPNILGGFIVVSILMLLWRWKIFRAKEKIAFGSIMLVSLYALWATQCISAIMALVVGIIVFKMAPVLKTRRNFFILFATLFFISPIVIFFLSQKFPDNLSFTRRQALNQAAFSIILHNPLKGIGLNNFTAVAEQYHPSDEVIRFTQPVHNVGLLWLAETGIFGTVWLMITLKLVARRSVQLAFIILLPILALDHYIISQQTGILLLIFLSAFLAQRHTTAQ